jgi:hypothetical protein
VEYRADTLEFAPTHGGVSYRALCIPPEDDLNWSLAPLYSSEDARNNSLLASRWGELLRRFGSDRTYAPSVGFMSGEIVRPDAFTTEISLPQGTRLYRNRGLPADGTILEPHEGFAMSTGGCAALVVTGRGKCLVAHAGYASLVKISAFGGEGYYRPHFSVMGALAKTVLDLGYNPFDFRVDVLFALSMDEFNHPVDHPVYKELNERVWKEYLEGFGPEVAEKRGNAVHIDIGKLAIAQAESVGFGKAIVRSGLMPSHATTYHADPRMHAQRNAVIVVRTH